MEANQGLLEGQLDQLADMIEARILDRLAQSHRLLPLLKETPTDTVKENKRGRTRSKYQAQLHLKVSQEDKDWFMDTAQAYDVQNGKLFSHLRALHEMHEQT